MGNNNSSYGNGQANGSKARHLHHDYHQRRGHGKWGASNSDLGESSGGGNRMKKGYLPTRGYHGHNRLPSPHKVLPSVNPTSAAKLLKPTSNGAILHQGGTISGRKLLSELDPHSPEAEDLRRAMRKRSTASCPGNGDMLNPASGRSTPNLSVMDYNMGLMMERNGPRRASSKGGSSNRDYDSEPDLREMDENHHHHNDHRDDSSPQRSISPVPNSFTLIQESPAKKQIRTKKKGKAPPPPTSPGEQYLRVGGGGMGEMSCCAQYSPQLLTPNGESKKGSRLFKTKAESRLAAAANGPRSPEICSSDLEMSRGGVMRASMDANRFYRGERDRSSVHSVEAGLSTQKSSAVDKNLHLSNRKHSEGVGATRKASLGLTTASGGMMSSNKTTAPFNATGLSSRNNPEVKGSSNKPPLARDHSSASSSTPQSSNKTRTNAGAVDGGCGNRPSTTSTNLNGSSNIISLINQSGIATKDEHVPKSHRVSSTNLLPHITSYGQSSSSSNINSNNASDLGKPSVNQKANISKAGFISSSQTKTTALYPHQNNNNAGKPKITNAKVDGTTGNNNHVQHGRRKTTNAPTAPTSSANSAKNTNNKTSATANGNNDIAANNNGESNARTKFYFGMDAQPSPNKITNGNSTGNNKHHQTATVTVHQQSDSDNNNNKECRLTKPMKPNEKIKENMLKNGSSNSTNHGNHHEKVSSTNSSELLQIKQDSGSFDTSERAAGDGLQQTRESSSELSSSDLDIPLNIRPTLPAKKLGLPRFSPTAAWRALDSPSRVSVSGRSYSSEEGYGHDRIQRYMRQIPPSRANHHERSAGDSGISAGDAGSPANPELIADASAATTPSNGNPAPPVMNNGVSGGGGGGGRQYKLRDRAASAVKHSGAARDSEGNKCWTPEQDLDESSSSEFEDQQMSPPHQLPHPLHHSNSNVATRVLPAGLGTPPKLTTRNNLFERGRNSALGMVSDSDQYHCDRPGNLYVRSRKAMVTNGGAVGQQTHEEIKKVQAGGVVGAVRYHRNLRSQPWKQTNQLRQTNGNNSNGDNTNGSREFVGLDTNWFLSRSEPNSLNLIGNGEYDNIEQQELRLVLAEQDDDDDDEDVNEADDVEEELSYLPGEAVNNKERSLMMNMHVSSSGGAGIGDVVGNEYDEVDGCGGARLESEIGYGPSSMSFSSPLPSPSAVKISRNKVNRRHKEQHLQQPVASTTLLAEEFERDQQDSAMMASPRNGGGPTNVRYGDSSWERRPFSHIMYLPAYDSRRASSSAGTRRTKSVDNLNFSEITLYQPRKTSQYNNPISPSAGGGGVRHHHQRRSRSPSDGSSRGRRIPKRGGEDPDEPFERSQSVPPFTAEEENERRCRLQMEQQSAKALQLQQEREQAEREQKKKKFKFQSTLRVMERKKIEEQLSRDAEEKERRRLQEQEQMRKVEEEFQRKRVREKVLEMEAAANKANMGKAVHGGHNLDKIEMSNRYDVTFEPRNNGFGGNAMIERNQLQQRGGNSNRSSNISFTTTSNNNHHQSLYQRQEPEGAPASANGGHVGDLRKELICASRNRNAFPGATPVVNGKHSELTQEISEFCTPTGQRQYFDYRRAHEGDGYNHRSGPATR